MKKKIIGMAGLLLLSAAPALAEPPKEAAAPEKGELATLAEKVANKVKFSALVEVEAFTGKDFAGAKTSDVSLATVELRSEERRVGKECRSRWSPYH